MKVLDGKKIIFIGNSHTYRGFTVIPKKNTVLTQEERANDNGFFYQLCKANGMEVSVTNWTFGKHPLGGIFREECTVDDTCNGVMHEDYLVDRYFDYVVITPGVGKKSVDELFEDVDYIMKFFKSVNPQVKFVILGNVSVYGCNAQNFPYPGITENYKVLEKRGIIIADWGYAVRSVLSGEYKVECALEKYTKSSFIVSDGYHPNMLTGYITTLTAFCAITGISAVGQPYDFCTDASLSEWFDTDAYLERYYEGAETNMVDIFLSEADMLGLQKLVDRNLKEKRYR